MVGRTPPKGAALPVGSGRGFRVSPAPIFFRISLDNCPFLLYSGGMQTTREFRRSLDLAFKGLVSDHTGGSANRYDRVSEALVVARELVDKLARERDEAVSEVYAYAGSYQSVADALGLSRARVQQLVERGRLSAD